MLTCKNIDVSAEKKREKMQDFLTPLLDATPESSKSFVPSVLQFRETTTLVADFNNAVELSESNGYLEAALRDT